MFGRCSSSAGMPTCTTAGVSRDILFRWCPLLLFWGGGQPRRVSISNLGWVPSENANSKDVADAATAPEYLHARGDCSSRTNTNMHTGERGSWVFPCELPECSQGEADAAMAVRQWSAACGSGVLIVCTDCPCTAYDLRCCICPVQALGQDLRAGRISQG
jgi:hypothetical protein